jgi:hypothetical protein
VGVTSSRYNDKGRQQYINKMQFLNKINKPIDVIGLVQGRTAAGEAKIDNIADGEALLTNRSQSV